MSTAPSRAWVRMLGIVMTVLGIGPPVPAAEPKISWRTDYYTARKESEETGLPLLVQIGSEECFYCRKMESTTLIDPTISRLVEGFIPLKIDGNKETQLVKQLSVQLYPTTVLASSDGTIHAFVQGYVSADTFKEHLVKTSELVTVDVQNAKEFLRASRAIRESNYAVAIPVLQRLVLVTKNKTMEKKVRALLATAEKAGSDRLALAESKREGSQQEAYVRALEEIAKSFAGTPTSKEAEARLIALGVDRVDRIAITMRATALLTSARDLAKAGAYAESLEIAQLLDSTAEAEAAAKLIAEIQSDANKLAAASRRANEKAAALQLALAEALTAKGQTAEAAQCLELAIQLAPNSSRADQARGQLTKLRGGISAIPAVRQK